MSDGIEEREELRRRREQEKQENHTNRVEYDDTDEGEPERVDS
jgi:hypothetical protein